MERVTLTLPPATVKKLDRYVRVYKRSQAVNYAIMAMLSQDEKGRAGYRAAFLALVKDE